MKKIEMLRVRSTSEAVSEAMPSIMASIEDLSSVLDVSDVQIMEHTIYQGDIAVFILWEKSGVPEKSEGGLMIAERLQEIGALNHFVWLAK